MVDSARDLGQELGGELPPPEASPVEVPVSSEIAQESPPVAVSQEPAPDLGAAQEAVGAAAAETVAPAPEPAPIEDPVPETPDMPGMATTAGQNANPDVSKMVQGDKHEDLENSLVGDFGPNPGEVAKKEEILPGQEQAITDESVPTPYVAPPAVDGVTPLNPPHAVPAPPPEAPKIPAEEGVTPLEPEYAEPLPNVAPPVPVVEGAPSQAEAQMTPEQAKAEIKRLWDEVINPKSIEYEEAMREMNRTFSAGENLSNDLFLKYRDAYEEAQKAIAQTIELEEKYVRGQESNLGSQVG